MVYSAKHNGVGVSLQVKEWLEFRLQLICLAVDSEGFELLTYYFFNQQIVAEKLPHCGLIVPGEIK